MDYSVVIRPLSEDEGGGYAVFYPDLIGCMADGETPEEALANGRDALAEWLETNRRHGRAIPEPGSASKRAEARQRAAMQAVKDLSDAIDHVGGRLDRVEAEMADLREQLEHAASWMRFSELTGVEFEEQAPATEPRLIC